LDIDDYQGIVKSVNIGRFQPPLIDAYDHNRVAVDHHRAIKECQTRNKHREHVPPHYPSSMRCTWTAQQNHAPALWVIRTHDGDLLACDGCVADWLVALALHPCLSDGIRGIDALVP
jgi:hypothetical protein